MDSDSDSDFYGWPPPTRPIVDYLLTHSMRKGDSETISRLQRRVDSFDVGRGWENQQLFANLMSQQESGESSSAGRLHNIYEGLPGARQSTETVDVFLTRLPPSSTTRASGFDWIRIWNPFLPPGEEQLVRALRHAGNERLEIMSKMMAAAKASGMSLSKMNTEVEVMRKDAIDDLCHLAVMTKVLGGKWMLFVDTHSVDECWRRVARATANNELGIAAKVALANGSRHNDEHLICVYTKDFRDTSDIARVLNKLRSLELIRAGGKQIYYKTGRFLVSVQAARVHQQD